MAHTDPNDSDWLEDLLAEFWSRREAGESLTPASFLLEHAAHAAVLGPALQELIGAASMLPTGDLPASIGGYLVERRIGQGASGEVFAVLDAAGRPLALKRLLPHIAAVARAQQRLQREAAVLRELHHENIVEVVDVGEEGGVPFVVMERIDGDSLAAIVAGARQGSSPGDADAAFMALAGPGNRWQRIARCMAALARGLGAAHEGGVLHRDLKPGNVLLRRSGTPVLCDFGLAADADAATLTGTGDVLGTPHYMSPEQALGAPATPLSDVYGLGAILYELLTLAPPRHGADALQVLVAARSVAPRAPRAIAPDIPRELDLMARRAMAFRPRHRYAGAAAMAHALQLVADGGRPVGLTLGLGCTIDEFWRRWQKALLVAGAAVVVLLVAWLVVDQRQEARAERLRAATVAAVESQLDGDQEGVATATATMVECGDATLAAWLREPDAAAGDPFVQLLAEGHRVVQSDPKSAVDAFQRAVERRPGAAVGMAWLGLAAIRARSYEVAERELTAAVRALPGSVRLRIEFARVLDHAQKSAAAASHLQHAVTLPRADADTWHELGKRLANTQQWSEALLAIDKAIVLRGGAPDPSMLRTKARIFEGLGRHAEQASLLERVVEAAPSAGSWTQYGRALDFLHRFDEAASAYRRALELDQEHEAAIMNLLHLHAGSDRVKCEGCREFFSRHPEVYDPGLVDRYATAMLVAQEGKFGHAEVVAKYVRGVGGGQLFAAALAARLAKDLPAEQLGRLLRAQKVLRGEDR